MKTNNTKLIKYMLSLWAKSNDLIDLLFVVSKLVKKYGRILYNQNYINEISKKDENISNLLLILKITNNIEYKSLKNLTQLIKRYSDDYVPQFKISSDSRSHNDLLKKYINSQFGESEISLDLKEKIWIYISWEWWYYKKDLHSDIEKLLY